MRAKYIDEKYRSYFVFGTSAEGKVDLSNGCEDVCTVTKQEADTLIKDRDSVLELVHSFNERYPKQFEDCFRKLNF